MSPSSSDARARRLVRTLRSDLVASEVAGAAGASGLELLILRGPVIAARLYEPGERTYNDCDFLVPQARLPAGEAVLRELGFFPVSPRDLSQHWRRADGAEIDLHVSLWGVRRPASTLWTALRRHRQPLIAGGYELPALDRGATAFVLALHTAQHGAVVPHVLRDIERAVDRFPLEVWQEAAALAAETGSLLSFREGLTMFEAGRPLLDSLGLKPELTAQAVLRRRGVALPGFLFEGLSMQERIRLLGRRVVPGRQELDLPVDPGAAESRSTVVLAHLRRLRSLPARAVRLAGEWRDASREVNAFSRSRDDR